MKNLWKCRGLCVLLLLPLCLLLDAQEQTWWNQFHGPNSSGLAIEGNQPPVKFSGEENLAWKTDLDEGSSSPVIWEDHLYLTAFNNQDSILIVMCLDRKDGSVLWSDSIKPEKVEDTHAISNPAQSTPFADEDGLYVYFASCGLKCYGHDGSIKWEKQMPCIEKKWGNPVSPVVIQDRVILNLDFWGKDFRKLLALDKKTGEVAWSKNTFEDPPLVHYSYPGFSTPVRYGQDVVVHKNGGLAAFSIEDGSVSWWLPVPSNGIGTPLVYKDRIYVNTWIEFSADNRGDFFDYPDFASFLVKFDLDRDNRISREEFPKEMMLVVRPDIEYMDDTQHTAYKFFGWMDKDKDGTINESEWIQFEEFALNFVQDMGMVAISPHSEGEILKEEILWNVKNKVPEVPSPVALEDCIYMVENGGWLTCMDTETGLIHYQERLGAPGAAIASPVIADGHIYLASHNGRIRVIKAGDKPEVVHECKLPGKITATPAIADNTLYLRTSEALYAFSE